ncbi:receptor-like protein Cf-9 [Ipomoea triloba]|uniref:receptor-like protein Cf-9 n=1 Tax=Ipomoea triloba TaxID=35885 RepID=UPI00125E80F0|nr:receptor-like protein Cf-9 [Ipomoea triloba]
MGSQLLLILVIQCLLFLISFVSLSTSALCQNDQQLALLHFKQSFTIDPIDYCVRSSIYHNSYEGVQNSYPKTISWNSSIDCCLWDGVTCDESTGQVVELDLSCSQLLGTIDSNSTLFHLSHLQKLNLAGNRFDGSFISHKFGDFSYLTHLNLSSSRLSGCIPKGNQFNTFEKSSYEGNDGLRGYPMTKDCGNGVSSQPPTLEVLHQEDNVSILYGFTWKVVLLGYGYGTIFGMVMGSLMLLTRKPFWIIRIVEEEGYKIMRKGNRKRSKTPRSGRRRT